jgi:DNA (cytosine-5)-methyltransferase 1
MVITDAHDYLLKHFEEFDFIWSSPPCPTHSRINHCFTKGNATNPVRYADMKLYEEILLLKYHFKGKYCVENVISYYDPLIKPFELANHYFWTNFYISPIKNATREHYGGKEKLQEIKGFNIDKYSGINKIQTLRNCVEPRTGLHILNESIIDYQAELFR